jgi:hypothetical protein
MRKLNGLLAGTLLAVLVGCAGTPPAKDTNAAAPAAAAGQTTAAQQANANNAGETRVKLDASNIAEAQAAGYKIVTRNGERHYCRKDLVTGSHLSTKTTCLTEAERQKEYEAARTAMDEMRKLNPPPVGK